MIKEVVKFGGSTVIILDKSARKYFGIEEGDFINIVDIVKVEKPNDEPKTTNKAKSR